jgi:hypothetical protein
MARHQPVDPLRAQMLELCQQLQDRTISLRDYASTPDNAWLAKSELEAISVLLSEMEGILEAIRRYDAGED